MAKLTLDTVAGGYDLSIINNNFDKLETAFENTLSRDGTTPNTLGANLDVNNKTLYNVASLATNSLTIAGQTVVPTALNVTGIDEILNYATLRAYTGSEVTFLVKGHTTSLDGGGGIFRYDPTDTTSTDNGGTILVDAISRRWKREFSGPENLHWFGAAGNNTADDAPEITSTVAARGTSGGRTNLRSKTYRTDSNLTFTLPIELVGEGGIYSGINPAGIGAGAATLTFSPNASFDSTLTAVKSLHLGNPATGTRAGAVGISMATSTAGQNLPKFTIRDVAIGQGSSWGIEHLNNGALNINGALYGASFENNTIKGGIHLDLSGDSNIIKNNVISGTKIGINASLVSGASLLSIEANNITNSGGAILLDNGPRFRIIGNNCENDIAGAAVDNDAALFNLRGNNGVMYGGIVAENLLSVFGATTATKLLRLKNCRGTVVENNVFLAGVGGVTPITIESDCKDIRIGPNTYASGFAVGSQVNDSGEGTMGVVKTASLQNGWVAFAVGTATLKFIKSFDGMVHIYGVIKDGTTTNGTLIATLPLGFRPSEIIRTPIFSINAGVPQLSEMTIETSGEIRINYVSVATQVEFNFFFPANNLANATSFE